MEQTCLMLGAGHGAPKRRLATPTSAPEELTEWVTLDSNSKCRPQILFDLDGLEVGRRIPCESEVFDEVHAYEVLEHFGSQGDYRGLFSTFRELWRVLRPGGLLVGTCPSVRSQWLWGDPGHTRAITPCTINFLTRGHYDQLGQTAASDYRELVDPFWWEIQHSSDDSNNFVFALRKSS